MAARKKLTLEKLTALGPEALAGLLLEEAAGSKRIERQLRLLLAVGEGPEAVAKEVRKRINALARSSSYLDWPKVRDLARDLDQQRSTIAEKIAPQNADLALELMWRFLDLSKPTLERCDDNSDLIWGLFRQAVEDLGPIAQAASVEPGNLAGQVAARLRDDEYDIYDDLVPMVFGALGEPGASRLKAHLDAWSQEVEVRPAPSGEDRRAESHDRYVVTNALQNLADAQGDVDAYIATHDAAALENPVFASRIA